MHRGGASLLYLGSLGHAGRGAEALQKPVLTLSRLSFKPFPFLSQSRTLVV
jgi:hypothetical protein